MKLPTLERCMAKIDKDLPLTELEYFVYNFSPRSGQLKDSFYKELHAILKYPGQARSEEKRCSGCMKTKSLEDFYKDSRNRGGRASACKRCSTDRAKAYATRNPEKRRAHVLAAEAIRTGALVRQPCEKCGKPNGEAHHDDYTKPLHVRWLCRKHHKEHHSRKKPTPPTEGAAE